MNDRDIGALAAEFVLGTLDSNERAGASELLGQDDHFRTLVRDWERRFGELHLMVEPVEPPRPVWDRIAAKFEELEPSIALALPEAARAAEPAMALAALEAELRQAALAGSDSVADRPQEAKAPAVTPEAAAPVAVKPAVEQRGLEPQLRQASRDSHLTLRRWRLAAVVMTLVAVVLAGLMAAWKYVPERLPPQLQAAHFLNMRSLAPPPVPVRPTAPPESRFDE
jgi:anti-sigma-K factor RskA